LRGDLLAAFAPDPRDVMLALEIEPESGAVAEIAAESHRRLGGDRAAAVDNVVMRPDGTPSAMARRLALRRRACNSILGNRPGWEGRRMSGICHIL
jgi:ActR/RegA family two-component response regulator